MTISLRTRLYVVVAAILTVSVGASAVLSRRATILELRQPRGEPPRAVDVADVVGRLGKATAAGDRGSAQAELQAMQRESGQGFLLVDTRGRVTAASDPRLVGAAATTADGDGTLRLSPQNEGPRLFLRGVRTIPIMIAGERQRLFVVPRLAGEMPGRMQSGSIVPPWLVTSTITGGVALALVIVLARRILQPIGALTDAAHRMEGGDLEVRVAAHGDDEMIGLARAFNAMAFRLGEHERLRRQMVADIAHELRSPVTNLRCLLEGVQDGLERADRATIDALHDETMFLQRLITDLQDLALAESGSLPLHVALTQVSDVVAKAVSSMAALPGTPVVTVDVPAGLQVLADPDRLEQIVRNLLMNARQHTPSDGNVGVRAVTRSSDVVIEVSDTGAGIAAEHLPHVFDRFYRVDAARSRKTGGAGLGLAIVRQLVHAQGGTVNVASDGPGRGATFRISFPSS
jgi:signal transduction histidine kinase